MDGFLLVDDRDGRVLCEIADPLTALRLVEKLGHDHPELAEVLTLVRFGGSQGSLIGTNVTTRVRSLT